jgi:uncharacterized protein YhbP (UPF0306 family)
MNSESNPVDERIVKMIHRHHIFTLATCCGNIPYCSTCFYAYEKENNVFIFTSENDTRHIAEAVKQNRVAGAIALETKIIGKIRGVQFTGEIKEITGEELKKYKKKYLNRFPYVTPFIKETPFWIIEPDFFKLTDNNLGFGKKIIWTKHADL